MRYSIFGLLVFVLILSTQCTKLERVTSISTIGIESISKQSALFTMQIGDVADAANTKIGFCWDIETSPEITDSTIFLDKTAVSGEKYSIKVERLKPNTVYFVRGFTQLGNSILYSEEKQFTTLEVSLATIKTGSIQNITTVGATVNVEISDNGGGAILQKGICYNTSGNPSISDSTVNTSVQESSFATVITNMSPNKSYYLRAFARNEKGVAYGNVLELKTLIGIPVCETFNVSYITVNHAFIKGKLVNNGGSPILDSGFVYSESEIPTINQYKIKINFPGLFQAYADFLPPNKTIYLCAFARNAQGVGYGKIISFKTAQTTPNVVDFEGNSYPTAQIGSSVWMTQNLRSTKYADGTDIAQAVLYTNFEANVFAFGRLYDWSSVMKKSDAAKSQGVCPDGWHVPDLAEWQSLVSYFGGNDSATVFLKDTKNGLWNNLTVPYYQSAFAAPASGWYSNNFGGAQQDCYFWTSSISYKDTRIANFYQFNYVYSGKIYSNAYNITAKMAVRCVKNNP